MLTMYQALYTKYNIYLHNNLWNWIFSILQIKVRNRVNALYYFQLLWALSPHRVLDGSMSAFIWAAQHPAINLKEMKQQQQNNV